MSDEMKTPATNAIESSTLLEIVSELNRHIEKLECIGGTGVVHSVCEAVRHRKTLIDSMISNDKNETRGD